MAITDISEPIEFRRLLIGLSTDVKPTGREYRGSRFIEYDTGNIFITRDGTTWSQLLAGMAVNATILAAIAALPTDIDVQAAADAAVTANATVIATAASAAAAAAEAEIIEKHIHPDLSVTTPNGRLRVAALSLNSAPANTETITLGKAGGSQIVYTFLTDISGNPANANNVSIKVQASALLSVQKLMNTISAGVVDAANVHYFNNVAAAHPDFVAPYTTQRVSIGSAQHVAGATNIFICRVGDSAAAITLSDTLGDHAGTYKLTGGTRIYTQRYVLSGNATPATNSIAGPYQCVVPMNSVWHPTELALSKYDVGKIVTESISDDGAIVECDGYFSSDEVTFTPLWYGLECSREPQTKGCQTFMVSSARIPAGAGFYIKMRSDKTSTSAYIDFKAQYHLYPSTI